MIAGFRGRSIYFMWFLYCDAFLRLYFPSRSVCCLKHGGKGELFKSTILINKCAVYALIQVLAFKQVVSVGHWR
jgi:hypothetical protein